MTQIKVTRATPEMLTDILDIENLSFTCPWSKKSFVEAFEAETMMIYAAVDGDSRVCGFSCLLTIGDEGEIPNIAVHPSARKSGIGQLLMNAMLADCEKNGIRDIYLEVRDSNAPARHLYEKNGFSAIGVRRRYYQKPTEDAIVMRLELN